MVDNRFVKYTISENASVVEALTQIDANRQGFVVVIDEKDKVLGVLTDGDVRRSIIRESVVKKASSFVPCEIPTTTN